MSPSKAESLRKKIRRALARSRRRRLRLVAPDPAPRYDEIFYSGLAALDLL
jgi:hypothetical protein